MQSITFFISTELKCYFCFVWARNQVFSNVSCSALDNVNSHRISAKIIEISHTIISRKGIGPGVHINYYKFSGRVQHSLYFSGFLRSSCAFYGFLCTFFIFMLYCGGIYTLSLFSVFVLISVLTSFSCVLVIRLFLFLHS